MSETAAPLAAPTAVAGPSRALRVLRGQQSTLLLAVAFVALVLLGIADVPGFTSRTNVVSILVLASFLGIAAIGQTLVALVGGIDVSIPFVLTCGNIGMVKLVEAGWSPVTAVLAVLVAAALVGLLNGVLSWALGVHPLLVTLGVGFAVLGAVEIWFSNAQAGAPAWLTELSAANGTTFGMRLPPVVFIWALLSLVVVFVMRRTARGRFVYAAGDNPTAADRMHARRGATWLVLFTVSAVMAAASGILMLGFTGGGDITVGDPYMLTTIAAVVVGGTTLLGGHGGYGRTVVGTLLLGVLNTLLVGYGVEANLQQAVLGLIILAMVALYAREPHPRTRI